MSVIRVEKSKDYTVISNLCFKEKNMSLKAKGLLTFMLSLPEDWDYSVAGLVLLCKENESSIKSALKELEEFGYLKREIVRRNNGKFEDMEYIIYEKPQNENKPCESQIYKETTQKIYYPVDIEQKNEEDKTQNNLSLYMPQVKKPLAENPLVENPLAENHTQLNIYKQNTKKQSTKKQKESKKEGEENKSLLKNKNQNESFEELINTYTKNQELRDVIFEYIKMRKLIKKPLTNHALKLAFKDLDKFSQGEDKKRIDLLNRSILRSWQGIFPINEYKNKSSPKNQVIDYKNGDITAEDFE